MRIKHLILASCLAAPALMAAQPQVMATDAAGFLERGRHMYETNNYVGAIDQLNHLLGAFDATATAAQQEEAQFLMAASKFELGFENSVDALRDFIAEHPSSPLAAEAQMLVGNHYFYRGDYGNALVSYSVLDEGTLNDDDNEDLLYRKAYCHLQLGQPDEARGYYARLSGTRRYGEATKFYEAYIDYAHGDYDAALEKFAGINRVGELGYQAQYYVCQIDYMKGRYDQVITLGESLIEDNDNDYFTAEMHRLVGESYYHQGNHAAAKPHLESYMKLTEDEVARSAAYSLGVIDYQQGDIAGTMKCMTPVSGGDDAMAQSALLYLGQCHLRQGNNNQASMAFEKAAGMTHDSKVREEAYYNYAISQNQGGRTPFNKSIDMFEQFLNEFPDSKYADKVESYLYDAYLNTTDYDKALASIARIRKPGAKVLKAKQNVLYNKGVQAQSNGLTEQAASLFEQAIAVGNQDKTIAAESKLWLGEAQYREGKYKEAQDNLLAYINATPKTDKNYGLAQYYLGHTLLKQERWAAAQKAFEAALASGNLSSELTADVHNRIGDTKYYQQDFAGSKASHALAGDEEGQFLEALALGNMGKHADEVAALDRFIAAHPASPRLPEALLEKGKALIKSGDMTRAASVITELAKTYRDKDEAREGLLFLAVAQKEKGDNDKAIATFKRVISDYPTSQQAAYAADDLKRMSAERGELQQFSDFLAGIKGAPRLDVNEVERLTFEAAENAAIDGKIAKMQAYLKQYPAGAYTARAHYYVGRHLYETGKHADALKSINQALAQGENASFAEDALAIKSELLVKTGKAAEAVEVYRELEKKASTDAGRTVAQLGLMRAAKQARKWNDAINCASTLLSTAGIDAQVEKEALFTRAQALAAQGKRSQATQELKQLAGDVQNIYGIQAAHELALLQYNGKDYKAAEKTLDKAIDAGSPHEYWLAKCFILLSDTYYQQGRKQDAIDYLQSLKNNYPGKEGEIFNEIETRLDKWTAKTTKNNKTTRK